MSRIWRHYQLNDSWDISWTLCSSIGLVILICIFFAAIQSLQHIHCIPKPSVTAWFRYRFETKHFIAYSTLSVLFSTGSAFIIFIMFPVCSQWDCVATVLGYSLNILMVDSYLLSKIFVYLIFIGRLVNPHYIRLYRYPEYIQYSLWMMLTVLIIIAIAWNIKQGLLLTEIEYSHSIDITIDTVYGITDCILSISLMILFFRPICTKNTISADEFRSILRKYAGLSALQLTVAVSAQIAFIAANVLWWTGAPLSTQEMYADIRNVLSMVDCLLLIICIYSGFARQPTVR